MTEITIISVEERNRLLDGYKKMLEISASVEAFKAYVSRQKYSIDRDVCAAYFGFELPEVKNGAIHD